MKNKNAERIWKNTKSTIDSVQSFMELMKLKAINDEEWARLSNLEVQFLRGILYAESEKYVNKKKPLITKEGWNFVIDGYAIEECIRKILINNYKKTKKIKEARLTKFNNIFFYVGFVVFYLIFLQLVSFIIVAY